MAYCEYPDCNEEAHGRYCYGHAKQLQRTGKLRPLGESTQSRYESLSPAERVVMACVAVSEADAEDDRAWHAAHVRHRQACREAYCSRCPNPTELSRLRGRVQRLELKLKRVRARR